MIRRHITALLCLARIAIAIFPDPARISLVSDFEFPTEQLSGATIRQIAKTNFSLIETVSVPGRELVRKRLLWDSDEEVFKQKRERFKREVELIQSLNFPFIVQIVESFDYRIETGSSPVPAYTMEPATGSFEQTWRKNGGAAGWETHKSEYLSQLNLAAFALAFLHTAGIIHRDFKPQNLLHFPNGSLQLSDFGSASALDLSETDDDQSLTRTSTQLHTAGFAAPEQMRGLKYAQKQSDVFSFGATLFFLITGDAPQFSSEANKQQLTGHPEPIKNFVLQCIELDIANRFADGVELTLAYRQMYQKLFHDFDYPPIGIPSSLVEAHARILTRGEDRLAPLIPAVFGKAKTPLSLYCEYYEPRALKTFAKASAIEPLYRSFLQFNEKFSETRAWSDAEQVGSLYRILLKELKATDRHVVETGRGRAFARQLAYTLLDVSARLHRFEGGREFLRLFSSEDPILPGELLASILNDHQDGKKFLLTDVDFTRISFNPDVESLLS